MESSVKFMRKSKPFKGFSSKVGVCNSSKSRSIYPENNCIGYLCPAKKINMAAKSKAKPATSSSSPTPKREAAAVSVPLEHRSFQPGFWPGHWMPLVVLMAVSFAVYAVSVGYGYILDDEMTIWKNAYVQKGFAGLADIFASDSFMGYFQKQQSLLEGGRYRPLSLATFAVEVQLFGPNKPGVGHFFNIFFYGLTAIVLYRVLLGLFPITKGSKWYLSTAFWGAMLFVLHPLHVECVANIKGRDEILALLCSLSALYAALKYGDTQKSKWLLFSGLFLFLGMLSKENSLTFVAVIPLSIWFFQHKEGRDPKPDLFKVSLPLVLAALLFILIRYKALGFMVSHGKAITDVMNNPFADMKAGEKPATIMLTLAWYLKLLFVPHPLTHDYYPYHVPKVSFSDWRALLGLALHLAMGVWALTQLRKRSIPAYAILFYLLTLSIVSNLFVSVGTFMNERFLFMPSVAFCLMAAWFLMEKLPDLVKAKSGEPFLLGALLLGTLALLFGARSWTRVPDWKDAMSLNKAAVQVSENSARAHSFYVTSLYQDVYLKNKNKEAQRPIVEEMEHHISRALEINPKYSAALIMKSAVAASRFELDNQLDRFLNDMEGIAEKIPYNTNFRNYLDQYMSYLDGSNSDKYVPFCHRIGYELYFKKLKDPKAAQHFLEFGERRQTDDFRIFSGLSEVHAAQGNASKAAEYQAKAAAAK
jgi:protein O-mannosyl-transferase